MTFRTLVQRDPDTGEHRSWPLIAKSEPHIFGRAVRCGAGLGERRERDKASVLGAHEPLPVAKSAEGVAVIHVLADDETGELSAVNVLARHGAIPEQFEEEIRAL